MTEIQLAQLLENLPDILKGLRHGERYLLCDGEEPIATLVPYAERKAAETLRPEVPGDAVRHLVEEEVDDEAFSRDLEEGLKENAELLRRLAR